MIMIRVFCCFALLCRTPVLGDFTGKYQLVSCCSACPIADRVAFLDNGRGAVQLTPENGASKSVGKYDGFKIDWTDGTTSCSGSSSGPPMVISVGCSGGTISECPVVYRCVSGACIGPLETVVAIASFRWYGMSAGVIAGISAGVLLLLILVIVLAVCLAKRRRRRAAKFSEAELPSVAPAVQPMSAAPAPPEIVVHPAAPAAGAAAELLEPDPSAPPAPGSSEFVEAFQPRAGPEHREARVVPGYQVTPPLPDFVTNLVAPIPIYPTPLVAPVIAPDYPDDYWTLRKEPRKRHVIKPLIMQRTPFVQPEDSSLSDDKSDSAVEPGAPVSAGFQTAPCN
eukprot:TRINITY_DN31550_c0_g1_i1.p1 TRINITY_DN31550_c0_g1~~TRINITY_DN31550_c0_g1_i1.p1  ORF type:complete len:339 (+),score=22.39 TRINITY_DN31550_c0_g1_i1:128-1144(+)